MNDNKDIENGEMRSSEAKNGEAYYKKIGKIIKHNLKAAGIDEAEAADIVGLSPYLFQKILNGYIGLNIKEIKNICEKLNIDYSVALNDGDLEKIFMDKDPLEVVAGLIYEYMKLEWRSLEWRSSNGASSNGVSRKEKKNGNPSFYSNIFFL